ncbi:SBE2.1 [Symbiodinium sp. CCMP2592]|nr:SBE2.1 [Symbiodinium sp. CCMP2592]
MLLRLLIVAAVVVVVLVVVVVVAASYNKGREEPRHQPRAPSAPTRVVGETRIRTAFRREEQELVLAESRREAAQAKEEAPGSAPQRERVRSVVSAANRCRWKLCKPGQVPEPGEKFSGGSVDESSPMLPVRKVGWELVANKDLETDAKEPRPATSQSVNSGTLVSFESAASQASLIYCSSANSLRSVAEWVFPLQNRILPPEKTYDRQLLAPSDPRRQWLEEYIQGSLMSHRKMYDSEEWCSPPQIEIIRISEVFNPIVNNAYYQQLSQMQEVWGTDRQAVPEMSRAIPIRTAWDRNRMNEVLLFHGCKWDSLFGILREGFDPRLGGINTGAAFGIGCYFTTVASKADAYTERWEEWEGRPNCEIPADLRCLLVARVALGEISELRDADASLRRPPCSTADVRCDSVLGVPRARGGCVDYDEFVIYKQAQATPQFIVDYKHIDCCTCRSCMREAIA